MKRFHFRLQRILDNRENDEREKKRILGEAREAVRLQEKKTWRAEQNLREHQKQRMDPVQGKLTTAGDLIIHDRWERDMQQNLHRLREELVRLRNLEVMHRTELIEVTKERKVLERLKEKRLEEHARSELNEEQRTLDEIGGQAYSRDVPATDRLNPL